MVSAQYGTVFKHQEYGKLRKVYSIWIVPRPPVKRKNTIKKFSIQAEDITGHVDTDAADYDLLCAVIVNLSEEVEETENDILKLLNVLLSNKMEPEEKEGYLEKSFRIAMTENMKSEVTNMCNLSQDIFDDGIQ